MVPHISAVVTGNILADLGYQAAEGGSKVTEDPVAIPESFVGKYDPLVLSQSRGHRIDVSKIDPHALCGGMGDRMLGLAREPQSD